MTHIFKKFIGIILLLAMSIGYGSCPNPSAPPGYTTSTVTISGVVFSVCYPSTVYLNANDGEFTTYISLDNTAGTPAANLSLAGFAQPNSLPFTLVSSTTCTPSVSASDCGNNTNPSPGFDTDGVGEVDYLNTDTLPANTNSTFSVTFKATTTGTATWTPTAIVGLSAVTPLNTITINVLATCPTITASNAIGATACSNATSPTGSLSTFVTGGTPPYTFSTAGAVDGTVNINSAGVYSFTPNVAGPATGSFNYQAFDTFDCPSNTGTITVPIVNSPSNSGEILYTTTFGTPVTQPLNFTGGTAPYTFTTLNIVNGAVAYNSNTADFTFTQTDPGASYLQYTVTDANGCTISTPPIIFIYSCNPGYTATTGLVNNVIYALCYPSTVSVGSEFNITTSIINISPTLTTSTSAFLDIVPSTQAGYDPGLVFVSNTPAPPGTTFNPALPSDLDMGGMGAFEVTGITIVPSTTYQVTQTILATIPGPQTYTAVVVSNPNVLLTVDIDVVTCPSITGTDESITSCNNTVTGSLESLIIGGSGPYIFFETGIPSCGAVTISPSGAFLYTAPAGFTGPCSFEYFALDINGCPSSTGLITITANQGPIAEDGTGFTCENTDFVGTLAAINGTPPYHFSIITNGSSGLAIITDSTTGAFVYLPNANVFGTDSFTFQVTDSLSCTSNIATFTILISENPIASTTGISDCADSTVSGSLAPLVTVGSPPYVFSSTGSQVGGTATVSSTGLYTFIPTAGFSGPGGFVYEVTDSVGCSATGAVDIFLDTLVAGSTGLSTCINSLSGSLQSFVFGGIAPFIFTGPLSLSCAGSTVAISPTGLYTYAAPSGFSGPCNFVYEVTDAIACSSTGTITITANSPLIAGDGTLTTCANTAVSSSLANFIGAGATPPLVFTIVSAPTHGTFTAFDPTTGAFTYTPTAGFIGTDSFTYQVSDSAGCISNVGTITIDITSCCVITAPFPALVQQLYFNIPPVI